MANEEHLAILRQGVEAWNAWRSEHAFTVLDLRAADLSKARLEGANLHEAILHEADLGRANLRGADLGGANLREAFLSEADLDRADLSEADLRGAVLDRANLGGANLGLAVLGGAVLRKAVLYEANLGGADLGRANLRESFLHEADLSWANLHEADLSYADLGGAHLYGTIFADVDLRRCTGLETCEHIGPSTIDYHTLQRSGLLPLAFLRGVGLPDALIDYLPTLLNQPIQMHSCFISYSSKDGDFAQRLHADLQNKGVRCWFAPHDMPIGAKILDAIDEAIRLRDKVLLILSEHAIASDWVEGEVTRGLDEERERKRVVLFPIRVDNAVMETAKPWARLLRGQRSIGDFTRWKEHDAYQKALDRLLRDLRVERA